VVITEKTFADVPKRVICPFEIEHVWKWFLELDRTRIQSGFGVNPITHTEITHWANGMEIKVTPFERKALRAVDEAYMTYQNSKANKENVGHSK
jgi:hypothetical protein